MQNTQLNSKQKKAYYLQNCSGIVSETVIASDQDRLIFLHDTLARLTKKFCFRNVRKWRTNTA